MQGIKKRKIACPICKNAPQQQMNTLKEYWYCDSCSLGWIKKIPKTTYKDNYYTSGSSFLAKAFIPLELFFYKMREAYVGLQNKNLYMDIGAGDGNFLKYINAKKKIGVEISLSGRIAMKKIGLLTLSNKEFLAAKKLHADYISFWHVLEHVDNPLMYVKAAKKQLASSGKILIAVPNCDSFEFTLFKRFWFHLAPQYHIWFFSPLALKKLLYLADLEIERIDYWAPEHQVAGILQSFINKTTNTDNTLHKLIKRKQDLTSLSHSTLFWVIFWCTIGLPLVLCFWIIASLSKKSGAIVVIASKNRSSSLNNK